ncbi:MAG: YggS family pyridoxal phosphate-dependent enzyme [Gemmatimonadota bacterium]
MPERLRKIEDRVAEACARSGRGPAEIRIVAVTKGHPARTLIAALEAGLLQIGENRVGEAMEKFSQAATSLESHGATRHMVGHLQRNKARDAVTAFDWIQSVDSMRLARALSRRMEDGQGTLPVLIEVNAGGEEQKHGFSLDEVVDQAAEIADLPGLSVRGLMTMAPLTSEEPVLRATFRRARSLFERMTGPDTLSMGMSSDYGVAIEEGSTMLRLGTALFGTRAEG